MNKTILYPAICILGTALISWKKLNPDKTNADAIPAFDVMNCDVKENPRNNFYRYTNGNWLKNNPIPATESGWGSFNEIRERNSANLRKILEEASQESNPAGSNRQMIGDYFYSAMDTNKIEQEGIKPLKPEFEKINSIKSLADIPALIAHLNDIGINAMFNIGISPDEKNSSRYIVQFHQGGINLPDRDYYLQSDEKSDRIKAEYLSHIQKILELSGDKKEKESTSAKTIINIETDFAKISRTGVQLRDPEANYNKKTLAEFQAITPSFNWEVYFTNLGISPSPSEVIVGQPEFYAELNNILKKYSINDWKNYFKWNLVHEMSPRLNKDLVNETFHFYGTILSGAKEIQPRWKRAMNGTDGSLGMLLGQLYVEKYFTAESKKRVNEMINNLFAAYKERINTRDWMSEETKKQALIKLEAITRKIGFPDKWRDYTGLQIKRDSYVLNYMRISQFDTKYVISKMNTPVDKTEWVMTPPTVNAYYNSSFNEIVFPAGIMQPPMFNPGADDAVNYGSMGAVIGHELTHGFDDHGCQFDADGNLKNWWTEQDKEKFKTKTQMLVKQANAFIAIDTLKINGELTLGENIADLGGLTLSYYAFKKSLQGKPVPEKIDGFTAEQRFFIGWAQAWRNNMRPEALRNMVMTNPHSPTEFRVNGPLSNMKEFYEAFNVKPGDAMYRAENERIEIW